MNNGMLLERIKHWARTQPGAAALIENIESVSYDRLRCISEHFISRLSSCQLPMKAVVAVEAVKTADTIALIYDGRSMAFLSEPIKFENPTSKQIQALIRIYHPKMLSAGERVPRERDIKTELQAPTGST